MKGLEKRHNTSFLMLLFPLVLKTLLVHIVEDHSEAGGQISQIRNKSNNLFLQVLKGNLEGWFILMKEWPVSSENSESLLRWKIP